MLIKHKHIAKDATGADVETELELDIAEHVHNSKHKIKSDGAERELTFAEMLERMPLADGAFRRMREAAAATKERDTIRKQVEQLGARLKDPKGAREILAKAMGGPERAREFVEQWVSDIIAEEKMTPAQREARQRETEADRKLREREEGIARKERAFEERERASTANESKRIQETYAREWPGHLERAGIKPTERAMRMMASVHREALDNKFTLTDEQAAREVAKEYGEHLGEQGKALPSAKAAKEAAELAELEKHPGRNALPRSPGGQFAARDQRPPPATLEEYRAHQREAAEEDYQRNLRRR